MKKLLFYLSAALCLLTACNDAPLVHEEAQGPPAATAPNAHAISMEQALANLDAFLTDGNASRSNHHTVANVKTVKYAATRSRAEADAVDCDNLLYVANFADNQGYAILAADDRIPAPVLALTDRGNLTDSSSSNHRGTIVEDLRLNFEGYPDNGPGLVFSENNDSIIGINPNTINLREAIPSDTLVGNFFVGENTLTDRNTQSTDPEDLPLSLCISYAVNSIKGNIDDLKPEEFKCNHGWFPEGPSPDPGVEPWCEHDSSDGWRTIYTTPNYLAQYTHWKQTSPYNNYCPITTSAFAPLLFWRRGYVGCAPLSIGKIYVHNNTVDNSYKTDSDKQARMLRQIGLCTKSIYVYEGTFTTHWGMKSCLKKAGYKNVNIVDYNFDGVKKCIDEQHPILIMSIPGVRIDKSHCWNLDGYKIKEKITYRKHYYNQQYRFTDTIVETTKMVHCDFGWGGSQNGYYVDGIFRLNDKTVEKDNRFESTNDHTHYNNFLKIITYTL